MKCPECNTENPKDIQHCEKCGEKLIEDEFKLYSRRIIYIGLIVSAIGLISDKILNLTQYGIPFNDLYSIGKLIGFAGGIILAYRWLTLKNKDID